MSTENTAGPSPEPPAGGSADKPTAQECEVALGRMMEFLDSELAEADSDAIRQHLAECEPCLEEFDVESAVKALVGRCCRSEVAPEGLRTKIQVTLTQVRVQY